MTVLGEDRPGLVDAVAGAISDHGGSWIQSHLARVDGQFAGIVAASVPDAALTSFRTGLDAVADAAGLTVAVAVVDSDGSDAGSAFDLELIGPDRQGVVRDLTRSLARLDANIDELVTETRDAPMAGGRVFELQATVRGPGSLDTEAVISGLTDLGTEFIIEVNAR